MQIARKTKEKSGSCANVVIIIEERIYIANVGDSRAIMSGYTSKLGYLRKKSTVYQKTIDLQRKLSISELLKLEEKFTSIVLI